MRQPVRPARLKPGRRRPHSMTDSENLEDLVLRVSAADGLLPHCNKQGDGSKPWRCCRRTFDTRCNPCDRPGARRPHSVADSENLGDWLLPPHVRHTRHPLLAPTLAFVALRWPASLALSTQSRRSQRASQARHQASEPHWLTGPARSNTSVCCSPISSRPLDISALST